MIPRYLEARPSASARPRGALVLIHAFPLNARMWERQLSLAGDGWHVLVPQLRGFDGGAGEPPAASVDDYAGDVIDLLDSLHIDEAVIGGLSLGGYITFAILRHAARYIHALVLADTKSQADTPEGVEGRKRLLQTVTDKGPAAIADEMVPKLLGETTRRERPEIAERVREFVLSNPTTAIAGAIRALMSRPDSTPLLETIHVPTLIVVGAEDTITPPSASEEMHRAIHGSELVQIPGAGHLANLEQPAAFDAALARFLSHRV
ncbi:MAG TPA: alpha/beta fold hydrolase [Vicinamibacterales bacterium]|nr:alpha/beta fold hydrolase [Vicinamibacterales bacterium]